MSGVVPASPVCVGSWVRRKVDPDGPVGRVEALYLSPSRSAAWVKWDGGQVETLTPLEGLEVVG